MLSNRRTRSLMAGGKRGRGRGRGRGGRGRGRTSAAQPSPVATRVCLWEFSQNDARRDSGSKLVRQGLARQLDPRAAFQGIVLAADAAQILSPADAPLIQTRGLAGVNCSWRGLDAVPFGALGRPELRRRLPSVAARTSNFPGAASARRRGGRRVPRAGSSSPPTR